MLRVLQSFAIAIVTVGLATIGVATTHPFWADGPPPLGIFVLPLLASAWLGDALAIAFATLLAVLVIAYVVPGGGLIPMAGSDQLRLAVFLAIGASVAGLVQRVRRSERRRRSAAEELRATEHRLGQALAAAVRSRDLQLRVIIDAVPALIAYVDAQARYQLVNRAYEQWFGLHRDAIVGRTIGELLGDEHAAVLQPHLQAALAGQTREFETEMRHRDGTLRVLRASYVPDVYERQVQGVFVLVLDVTEDRHREDALREAEREARRANDVKDQFLATLSHELRTPLNAILGYARMAHLGAVPPARAVEVIERNAQLQARLVEDLLDVSRMVSGKLQFVMGAVDPAAIVADVAAMLQPLADTKGVHLSVVVDPAARTAIEGDAERLRQMLVNLASNAIKFTPAGGAVRIRLRNVDSDLECSVEDTGVGIAREFLPLIFDPFRQADSSATREHGGLGLGLAIARAIADAHRGTITATSEGVGLGATFTVRLPMDHPDAVRVRGAPQVT